MRTFALVLVLLAACVHPTPPPPPPPVTGPTCQTACDRLAALRCRASQPTAEGSTCPEVCDNAETGPGFLRWDLAALSVATACP